MLAWPGPDVLPARAVCAARGREEHKRNWAEPEGVADRPGRARRVPSALACRRHLTPDVAARLALVLRRPGLRASLARPGLDLLAVPELVLGTAALRARPRLPRLGVHPSSSVGPGG